MQRSLNLAGKAPAKPFGELSLNGKIGRVADIIHNYAVKWVWAWPAVIVGLWIFKAEQKMEVITLIPTPFVVITNFRTDPMNNFELEANYNA